MKNGVNMRTVALLCLLPGIIFAQSVVRVVDGDTVKIGDEVFRLYGIDAPESDQEYGAESAGLLADYLNDDNIALLSYRLDSDKDRYGRSIAVFYYDGLCVNGEMVRLGAAWVYTEYCDEMEFLTNWPSLERSAILEKRGLWAGTNVVAPWEWRKF